MNNTLLIIEDESLLGNELLRRFQQQGFFVKLTRSIEQAKTELLENKLEPLVIISDMNLPDGNGLDLMAEINSKLAASEWLFLTAYGSVAESVKALQLGACDFLEKPCNPARLDLVVAGAKRSALAQRRLQEQTDAYTERYSPEAFLGSSHAAEKTRGMLRRLSNISFSSIIISGESGTGKGLAAKILHHSSQRKNAPFVALNCTALPHDLLESELFGHEAGAFTGARKSRRGLFEQADGGTLFLDEIGEMPIELQSKLLKAIEDQTVRRLGSEVETKIDIQIIAASNRNFSELVRDGRFRNDLFHRLSLFELKLPSLKERKEDLDELVPALIKIFNNRENRNVKEVPSQVWQQLKDHNWPGNVRELSNVIERGVLFSENETLPIQWLQLEATPVEKRLYKDENCLVIPLDGTMDLDSMERYIIESALQRCQNSTAAAARMLGTSREKLRYRKQKHGL